MRVLGSSAAWRYIATNSGAMRQYPGRQTYNNRSAENCHYHYVALDRENGEERLILTVYMLWFNFILGLNFFSFVSNSLSYITIPKNKGKKNLNQG